MYPAFDLERAMLPAIMDISARAISLAVPLVASGHATAAPPSVANNFRRSMWLAM